MASIRGAFRFSKNVAVIMLLGAVYVLGLSVKTVASASSSRLPRLHALGDEIRNRLRRPA
ncbi:hypothetical protein [Haloarcula brevis]|uniref:hypothetical protein n=1 Tax=Haloarcula brevis TaxID=3111453 RepID=UPI00300EA8CE